MTFEAWEASARRYTVLRHTTSAMKWKDKPEATGLTLEAARTLEAALDAQEQRLHPGTTTWQRDIFSISLENPWKRWTERLADGTFVVHIQIHHAEIKKSEAR